MARVESESTPSSEPSADQRVRDGVRTFDINEVAAFLKVDRTTALSLAGSGQLPGAKIGRAWVFLESDVVAYLKGEVERQSEERRRAAGMLEEISRREALLPPPNIASRRKRGRLRKFFPELPATQRDDSADGKG
jgi:excisionase family DNA binding protein